MISEHKLGRIHKLKSWRVLLCTVLFRTLVEVLWGLLSLSGDVKLLLRRALVVAIAVVQVGLVVEQLGKDFNLRDVHLSIEGIEVDVLLDEVSGCKVEH